MVTQVDVRKQEQVARWITHAVDTFGRLDGGANVAGVAEGDGDSNVQTMVRWKRLDLSNCTNHFLY